MTERSRHPACLCLAAVTALFHLWANSLGTLSDLWRNALHFGLLGAVGFALLASDGRARAQWRRWGLVLLACLPPAAALYIVCFEPALHARNLVMTVPDLIAAATAVVACLELCRRTSGLVMPALAAIVVAYVLWWGRLVGGVFHFPGLSFATVMYRVGFTDDGLFGMIATISSTYVFMFVLFAAFLIKSGAGEFIIALANRSAGRLTGGPGLVAVVASGLLGTISGSAVANTAATGAVTIPLMKRAGFSPRFAAAVETAASTGGQLMPPIMGAGAFIMAQWTDLPYLTIVAAATLPALLYYFSIAVQVYLTARKLNLQAPPAADEQPWPQLLSAGLPFLLPIAVLIGLLMAHFTPTFCAGIGIVSVIGASWLTPTPMGWRRTVEALALGTETMVSTGILLVATGVVVGGITMTGTALALSQMIGLWAHGYLLVALILTALASLVLGMGLPVTAAYIVLAVLAAPTLTGMGVSLLAAHLFIYWVSQDSNVTPPVCLAAFTGAAIAGSPPMATGLAAWRLAKALYIVPLLFVYTALIDGNWSARLQVAGFALPAFVAVGAVTVGHLRGPLPRGLRVLAGLAAVLLFTPYTVTRIAGLALFTVVLWRQVR